MANEVGTTLLNSLTNSKFDIGNMAKVLAEADVATQRATIDTKETKTNSELSALTYLKSNFEAFQGYLTDLTAPSLYEGRQATSSDESVISVKATGDAASGAYQMQSMQLAQAHTLVSNKTFNSPSDAISMGTLSINVGGEVKPGILIDSSNNTLEGLQNTINNGDYGVNASIINNGGVYQMMFSSKNTGAASEVTLSGLADFTMADLTTTSEAQDAVMSINGLQVSNSSNTFDEVIDGLSIQLKSTSQGSVQSLSVAADTQKVVDTVNEFVTVYNQLDTIFDELGSYKTLTEEEQKLEENAFHGDLAGSSLLRDLKSQVRGALSGAISELTVNNTLTSIGISFDREGQLSVDDTVLNSVAANNLDAIGKVFSQGGTTDDPLMRVIGGNERTQAGSYAVDITTMATRAAVSGGGVTPAAGYSASSDRVLDPVASLTVATGAGFDLALNGGAAARVDFTAGSYATKDEVAVQMQTDIFNQLGATVSVTYDTSQARFEFTNSAGQVDISAATSVSNQGFSATSSYVGERLIDVPAAASFDVSIDGSTTATASIATGQYTLSELAEKMRTSINNMSEVSASGAKVSVSTDGGILNITSERYGFSSDVNLSNFVNLGNAGLTADVTAAGVNVEGTIATANGLLNLGAYADSQDGRKIKISDYAVLGSTPAEVRGLEFEILGGATGSRGDIVFSQGFASRLDETIKNVLSEDNGLVSSRIDSLASKNDEYVEKRDELDVRYEKLLLKYQFQFSALQSLMSSSQQTSDFLTATFSNNK